MDRTPYLELPYIMPSQAQKHVTHNEALKILDALVQLTILDRDLTSPPGSPAEGDRYIVGGSATGAWSGHDDDVAAYLDGAWSFFTPIEGWIAWAADEDLPLAFDGAAWGLLTASAGASAAMFGVNTTADATNRLAVKSDAVLFSHDDVTPGSGDMRQKLNKDGAGDTVSQLYQTGFSGRAETGLVGDDDFVFKVSPDGSTWHEAIRIDKDDGLVSLPKGQLAFPATQNASANANTLDDYEEGTFTPTIIGSTTPGSHTYAAQAGAYVKIGCWVYCQGHVQITTKDGSMAGTFAQIGGLPFTPSNPSGGRQQGLICEYYTIASSRQLSGLRMSASASAYILYLGAGNAVLLAPADIQDGSTVSFYVAYRTAS